jgi:hypothetical protein
MLHEQFQSKMTRLGLGRVMRLACHRVAGEREGIREGVKWEKEAAAGIGPTRGPRLTGANESAAVN